MSGERWNLTCERFRAKEVHSRTLYLYIRYLLKKGENIVRKNLIREMRKEVETPKVHLSSTTDVHQSKLQFKRLSKRGCLDLRKFEKDGFFKVRQKGSRDLVFTIQPVKGNLFSRTIDAVSEGWSLWRYFLNSAA